MSDKPEVRLSNGRFGPGNKTGGRKPRVEEKEMLDLFNRAVPIATRIKIIQRQVNRALKGSLESTKWLWSYMYGNPVQRSEHSGEGGAPLEVIFRMANMEDKDNG